MEEVLTKVVITNHPSEVAKHPIYYDLQKLWPDQPTRHQLLYIQHGAALVTQSAGFLGIRTAPNEVQPTTAIQINTLAHLQVYDESKCVASAVPYIYGIWSHEPLKDEGRHFLVAEKFVNLANAHWKTFTQVASFMEQMHCQQASTKIISSFLNVLNWLHKTRRILNNLYPHNIGCSVFGTKKTQSLHLHNPIVWNLRHVRTASSTELQEECNAMARIILELTEIPIANTSSIETLTQEWKKRGNV